MKRLASVSPSVSQLQQLAAAGLACALVAGGCASYVVPAASDAFFDSPFRTIAREASPPVVAPARRQPPALAITARTARSTRELPLEKFTLPPAGEAAAETASATPAATPAEGSLQPAGLVEVALRSRGARFGTDGQVASLYAYMRREHAFVSPRAARPGDVLFFAISAPSCADHTGVVEAVDDIGRITFREVRAGQVRTSYVHPGDPTARRWSDGRVVNSFLRPRRTDDPPAAKYFAGEMLCGVARVRR